MNKQEFVAKVAAETKTSSAEAVKFVEAYNKVVVDSLSAGKNVIMRGFGTFELKHRAQKVGQNITKKTTVVIPEHNVPVLKFAKEVKLSCK